MSMQGDITRELVIQNIVVEIEKELQYFHPTDEGARALRKIGRVVLTQFGWTAPAWVVKYRELFKEGR